MNLKAGSDVT